MTQGHLRIMNENAVKRIRCFDSGSILSKILLRTICGGGKWLPFYLTHTLEELRLFGLSTKNFIQNYKKSHSSAN